MLARILRRVLFPDPLRPTIPKNSPRRTLKRDALQGIEPAEVLAPQGMHRSFLERIDPLVGNPERLRDSLRVEHDRGRRQARGPVADRALGRIQGR